MKDIPIFIAGEYAGAKFKIGTRVKKILTEPGDRHPIGAQATILSSVGEPSIGAAYFVQLDVMPGVPVFVVEKKLGPL